MFTLRRALIPLTTLALALTAFALQAADTSFTAQLTGEATVPNPIVTKATGTLQLTVSQDGSQIGYKLTVTDIANPSVADLHLGPPTMNGPVVVKLFPRAGDTAKKGQYSGVLAEGKITARDLLGPLTGGSLADLIDQLKEGNVYTNVHTNDGAHAANSGTGNYQLGEIRGQLK